jgi:hypothetical protein
MKPAFLIMLCAVLAGAQTLEQLQAMPNNKSGEPTLAQRYTTMMAAGLAQNTITITEYQTRTTSQYRLDRHGKTMFDRHGNPKMKEVTESVAVEKIIPAETGILFYVDTANTLLGTQSSTQYYYVSPACLNSWWCHALAGDPGAQTTTQPVSLTNTWFGLKDATGMVYICREFGSYLSSFTVNKVVKFGFNGDLMVLVDDHGVNHTLEVVQKRLPPPAELTK